MPALPFPTNTVPLPLLQLSIKPNSPMKITPLPPPPTGTLTPRTPPLPKPVYAPMHGEESRTNELRRRCLQQIIGSANRLCIKWLPGILICRYTSFCRGHGPAMISLHFIILKYRAPQYVEEPGFNCP